MNVMTTRGDIEKALESDGAIRVATTKLVVELGDAAIVEQMKKSRREQAYAEMGQAIANTVERGRAYILRVDEATYHQDALPGIGGTPVWTLEVVARLLPADDRPIYYTALRGTESK